jgi:hypothetical protein
MNRTKYDGKLTDSLIQVVVEAERRHSGLEASVPDSTGDSQTSLKSTPSALAGHPDAVRIRPTPTEQAEAWRRSHYDEEGEDGGRIRRFHVRGALSLRPC